MVRIELGVYVAGGLELRRVVTVARVPVVGDRLSVTPDDHRKRQVTMVVLLADPQPHEAAAVVRIEAGQLFEDAKLWHEAGWSEVPA